MYKLIIMAGLFSTDAECERAKVLTIPGDIVTYECIYVGGVAPIRAPLPVPRPEATP